MSNKELLDYAVENISEWNDEYTELWSDYSANTFFWSTGDWLRLGYVWSNQRGNWKTAQVRNIPFKTIATTSNN